MEYLIGVLFGVGFFVWLSVVCVNGTKKGFKSLNEVSEGVHTWAKKQKK